MFPVGPAIHGVSGTNGKESKYSFTDKVSDTIKRYLVKSNKTYKSLIAQDPYSQT